MSKTEKGDSRNGKHLRQLFEAGVREIAIIHPASTPPNQRGEWEVDCYPSSVSYYGTTLKAALDAALEEERKNVNKTAEES